MRRGEGFQWLSNEGILAAVGGGYWLYGRCQIPTPSPIGVGRGPSGPSIEGPFCCAVRLCRALETEKKREKKIRERSEKIAEI